MDNLLNITASLVVYKNSPEILQQAIISLFNTPLDIKLYVFDNSPTPDLKNFFCEFNNIDYIFNNGHNVGFSKGQNLALKKSKNSDYHLVMNPDVYFDSHVIPELINYLNEHPDVGLITPKICYPNGEIQYLCKRYPSVFLLFGRRFLPKFLQKIFQKYLDLYEMRDIGYDTIIDVPYLSGCFMLFRKKYLDEIGYFDENIFMYLEDADITLRMSKKYRTIFYPYVHIYHYWARGSHNSLKLTWVTIKSAIYLFNKHGWKIF